MSHYIGNFAQIFRPKLNSSSPRSLQDDAVWQEGSADLPQETHAEAAGYAIKTHHGATGEGGHILLRAKAAAPVQHAFVASPHASAETHAPVGTDQAVGRNSAAPQSGANDAKSLSPAIPQLNKLEDPGIRADVAKYLTVSSPDHASLDHAALTHILQDAAVGGVTASEFRTLKTLDGLINSASGLQASQYDAYITHALIAGNPANVDWTGGGYGYSVPLGDLKAGSTELQADRLIGKWFLGTDRPSLAETHYTWDYGNYDGPLFDETGTPKWQDFHQGALGDCWLVAGLGEIALKDPDAIKSMFIDNHDGTYGVRFYDWHEKPVYVTVDSQVAGGVLGGEKWAVLIEKAFAQLNDGGTEQDREITWQANAINHDNDDGKRIPGNYYVSVEAGFSELIHYVTGKHTRLTQDMNDHAIWDALKSGQEVLIGAGDAVSAHYVSNHMYTVVDFNEETHQVKLRNPWGSSDWHVFWTDLPTLSANGCTAFYATSQGIVDDHNVSAQHTVDAQSHWLHS